MSEYNVTRNNKPMFLSPMTKDKALQMLDDIKNNFINDEHYIILSYADKSFTIEHETMDKSAHYEIQAMVQHA